MNSKPKSWAALKKSVEAADIAAMPSAKLGAKRADKLILICIAEAGSDVGVGARPGNALLEQTSGLRWSQCHEHIVKLEKVGMIERSGSGGRGLASVYRIIWNHPVFPDRSPNGREWFIEKPSGLNEKNPPVSSEEPSGLESETIRLRNENPPVSDVKPSGLEAKPSGVRPEHILIPSEEHPHPSQTAPSAQPADGWKEFLQNLRPCPEMEKAPMNKKVEAELRELVAKHGGKLMARTACWWFKYRPQGIAGMKMSPWFFFVKEYEPYLREAFDTMPGPDGKTPAQKREDEQQEAAIAFSRQCWNEVTKAREPEISIEESERMLREAK